MGTATELYQEVLSKLNGLQTRIIALTPNDLIFSVIGESVLYGCKVTQGNSTNDYEILLNGQASGDSANLNPDGSDTPSRGYQYWNIASGKDGAFRAGDLTATVDSPPATGLARYDIAYVAVTTTGSVFRIAAGTPSADTKSDFDTYGLDSSDYGEATISDPTLPVGAIPVARIYVEDVYTGIQDARIADIRVMRAAVFLDVDGALQAANNLSDVASVATSQTNLQLGTGNSPTFTGLTTTSTAELAVLNAGDVAGSDYVSISGGQVDLRRATIAYVRNRTNSSSLYMGITNGAGTLEYPIIMDESQTRILQDGAEVARFNTDGFCVGGTPSAKLSAVIGGAYTPGNSWDSSVATVAASSGASGSAFAIAHDTTDGSKLLSLEPGVSYRPSHYYSLEHRFYYTTTEIARMDSNGVGIGVSATPDEKLHVKGTSADTWALVEATSNTNTDAGFRAETYPNDGTEYISMFARNDDATQRIDFSHTLYIDRAGTNRLSMGQDTVIVRSSTADGDYLLELYNERSGGLSSGVKGIHIDYVSQSPNNTVNHFLYCQDSAAQRLGIRSNGGIANYSANNVNLSDERTKDIYGETASYWDAMQLITIEGWRYKDQNGRGRIHIGPTAQSVYAAVPDWVDTNGWDKDDGKWTIFEHSVKYGMMGVLQEAQRRIESLESKVVSLESNLIH